jgi:hypothetical protein
MRSSKKDKCEKLIEQMQELSSANQDEYIRRHIETISTYTRKNSKSSF